MHWTSFEIASRSRRMWCTWRSCYSMYFALTWQSFSHWICFRWSNVCCELLTWYSFVGFFYFCFYLGRHRHHFHIGWSLRFSFGFPFHNFHCDDRTQYQNAIIIFIVVIVVYDSSLFIEKQFFHSFFSLLTIAWLLTIFRWPLTCGQKMIKRNRWGFDDFKKLNQFDSCAHGTSANKIILFI